MGITYQTPNRQRRKVMTAPLNAPPPDLATAEEPIADQPAYEPAPVGKSIVYWISLVAGVAIGSYAVSLLF